MKAKQTIEAPKGLTSRLGIRHTAESNGHTEESIYASFEKARDDLFKRIKNDLAELAKHNKGIVCEFINDCQIYWHDGLLILKASWGSVREFSSTEAYRNARFTYAEWIGENESTLDAELLAMIRAIDFEEEAQAAVIPEPVVGEEIPETPATEKVETPRAETIVETVVEAPVEAVVETPAPETVGEGGEKKDTSITSSSPATELLVSKLGTPTTSEDQALIATFTQARDSLITAIKKSILHQYNHHYEVYLKRREAGDIDGANHAAQRMLQMREIVETDQNVSWENPLGDIHYWTDRITNDSFNKKYREDLRTITQSHRSTYITVCENLFNRLAPKNFDGERQWDAGHHEKVNGFIQLDLKLSRKEISETFKEQGEDYTNKRAQQEEEKKGKEYKPIAWLNKQWKKIDGKVRFVLSSLFFSVPAITIAAIVGTLTWPLAAIILGIVMSRKVVTGFVARGLSAFHAKRIERSFGGEKSYQAVLASRTLRADKERNAKWWTIAGTVASSILFTIFAGAPVRAWAVEHGLAHAPASAPETPEPAFTGSGEKTGLNTIFDALIPPAAAAELDLTYLHSLGMNNVGFHPNTYFDAHGNLVSPMDHGAAFDVPSDHGAYGSITDPAHSMPDGSVCIENLAKTGALGIIVEPGCPAGTIHMLEAMVRELHEKGLHAADFKDSPWIQKLLADIEHNDSHALNAHAASLSSKIGWTGESPDGKEVWSYLVKLHTGLKVHVDGSMWLVNPDGSEIEVIDGCGNIVPHDWTLHHTDICADKKTCAPEKPTATLFPETHEKPVVIEHTIDKTVCVDIDGKGQNALLMHVAYTDSGHIEVGEGVVSSDPHIEGIANTADLAKRAFFWNIAALVKPELHGDVAALTTFYTSEPFQGLLHHGLPDSLVSGHSVEEQMQGFILRGFSPEEARGMTNVFNELGAGHDSSDLTNIGGVKADFTGVDGTPKTGAQFLDEVFDKTDKSGQLGIIQMHGQHGTWMVMSEEQANGLTAEQQAEYPTLAAAAVKFSPALDIATHSPTIEAGEQNLRAFFAHNAGITQAEMERIARIPISNEFWTTDHFTDKVAILVRTYSVDGHQINESQAASLTNDLMSTSNRGIHPSDFHFIKNYARYAPVIQHIVEHNVDMKAVLEGHGNKTLDFSQWTEHDKADAGHEWQKAYDALPEDEKTLGAHIGKRLARHFAKHYIENVHGTDAPAYPDDDQNFLGNRNLSFKVDPVNPSIQGITHDYSEAYHIDQTSGGADTGEVLTGSGDNTFVTAGAHDTSGVVASGDEVTSMRTNIDLATVDHSKLPEFYGKMHSPYAQGSIFGEQVYQGGPMKMGASFGPGFVKNLYLGHGRYLTADGGVVGYLGSSTNVQGYASLTLTQYFAENKAFIQAGGGASITDGSNPYPYAFIRAAERLGELSHHKLSSWDVWFTQTLGVTPFGPYAGPGAIFRHINPWQEQTGIDVTVTPTSYFFPLNVSVWHVGAPISTDPRTFGIHPTWEHGTSGETLHGHSSVAHVGTTTAFDPVQNDSGLMNLANSPATQYHFLEGVADKMHMSKAAVAQMYINDTSNTLPGLPNQSLKNVARLMSGIESAAHAEAGNGVPVTR